jgi:hypothetical protein
MSSSRRRLHRLLQPLAQHDALGRLALRVGAMLSRPQQGLAADEVVCVLDLAAVQAALVELVLPKGETTMAAYLGFFASRLRVPAWSVLRDMIDSPKSPRPSVVARASAILWPGVLPSPRDHPAYKRQRGARRI